MTKEEVLQVITDNITDNNSGAITAAVMRDTLNTMVEYTPEGSSAIPVFEGILEDSITITNTTVLDDTGGVVIYSSYHKKFVLSLDRAYYSSWGNVVAYMDITTGLPITNRLFEYNKQQYVFNGTDLVPLSIGIGYTYVGTATPSTTPITLTGNEKVFYIAVEAGNYTGFGQNGIKELTIFKSGEGRWVKEELGIAFNLEDRLNKLDSVISGNSFPFVEGRYFNSNSLSIGVSNDFAYCRIPVVAGETYIITTTNGGSTSAPAYCLVNTSETSIIESSSSSTLTSEELTIPSDGILYVNAYIAGSQPYSVLFKGGFVDAEESAIITAIAAEAFVYSNFVYTNGRLISADIKWPDGTSGVMSLTYGNGGVSVISYTHGTNTYENRFTYVNGILDNNEIIKTN